MLHTRRYNVPSAAMSRRRREKSKQEKSAFAHNTEENSVSLDCGFYLMKYVRSPSLSLFPLFFPLSVVYLIVPRSITHRSIALRTHFILQLVLSPLLSRYYFDNISRSQCYQTFTRISPPKCLSERSSFNKTHRYGITFLR